jgi:hypothetical protein
MDAIDAECIVLNAFCIAQSALQESPSIMPYKRSMESRLPGMNGRELI